MVKAFMIRIRVFRGSFKGFYKGSMVGFYSRGLHS